jgi:hypothetical protein
MVLGREGLRGRVIEDETIQVASRERKKKRTSQTVQAVSALCWKHQKYDMDRRRVRPGCRVAHFPGMEIDQKTRSDNALSRRIASPSSVRSLSGPSQWHGEDLPRLHPAVDLPGFLRINDTLRSWKQAKQRVLFKAVGCFSLAVPLDLSSQTVVRWSLSTNGDEVLVEATRKENSSEASSPESGITGYVPRTAMTWENQQTLSRFLVSARWPNFFLEAGEQGRKSPLLSSLGSHAFY